MTQKSWVARQAVEVPCWAKVAVELDPTELECKDKRRLYSSSGIETTLDVGGSGCEGDSSTWKLGWWAEGLPYNSQQKVYCMNLTMTISALTKTTSSTMTPLFTNTTPLFTTMAPLVTTSTALAPMTLISISTTTSITPHISGRGRFITRR